MDIIPHDYPWQKNYADTMLPRELEKLKEITTITDIKKLMN